MFGNGISALHARGIANQCAARIVKQYSVLSGKRGIAVLHVKGKHGGIAEKGGCIERCYLRGHSKCAHLGAARECKIADADQLAVLSEDKRGKPYVIIEGVVANLCHSIGDLHAHKIGAALKCGTADALQILGQLHLAQSRFALESLLTD